MRRKIIAVILTFLLCMVGCSSNIHTEKEEYLNNIYNAAKKIEEKDVKVSKDNFEMVSGTIKKIIVKENKRSLFIEDSKGMEYIFHINEHTIVMTFEKLKVGQEVDIIFNGILTRSIPPQGNAIIVNGLKV